MRPSVKLLVGTLALGFALALGPGAMPAAAQFGSPSGSSTSAIGASVGSGARALAMGGAFIAIADDGTASAWNPAGLSVLEKAEATLVWLPATRNLTDFAGLTYTYTDSSQRYTEIDDPFRLTQKGQALDFVSLAVPFRMGRLKLVPQLNYQRSIDFGLDPEQQISYSWTNVSLGRTSRASSTFTANGDYKGGLDVYAASLGLSFTQKLYLGASVNLWRNGAEGQRTSATTTGSSTSTTDLSFKRTFKGTNFNVGAMFRPNDKLRFGVVFKSPFDMEHTYTQDTHTVSLDRHIEESGTIRWPRTIGAGFAVLPKDFLTFSVDWTSSNWSKADYMDYSSVTTTTRGSAATIRRSGPRLWPTLFNPSLPEQAVINDGQFDTQQIRFGMEYVVRRPGLFHLTVLPLRLGVFSDQPYFKDTPELGKVNFNSVTGGFGLVWSHVTLDFAVVHQRASFRSQDFTNSGSSFTETELANEKDKFSSTRAYVSTIVRF